ncbi:hypothetical protein TNCV_2293301 [Trichonephila clavipes]|nr:hypothetical protein TNCV_2293301 [Trichonephila clavipes]
MVSYRQSSGASLWGMKLVNKITSDDWYPPIWCRTKKRYQLPWNVLGLHNEKLTAWCALWAGGIIGPYFFKNDEGHNVTVNDDRYRAMITNFFIPELNNHDVQEL